jgi:hypothetical protein|mmetsp:Transcript_39545/g.62824  ORF Transcript_39545/g.62824 Transcript_39545/m.62824 type:complete len:640 (-) Transcript_39545:134-2053(-)
MSHAASLAAVALLVASIGLDIAALVTTWWDAKAAVVLGESITQSISLWSVDFTGQGLILGLLEGGTSWDDLCNGAKLDGAMKDWCNKIPALRALVILAAIFSLFGAFGVAIGNYTGNTLVDAGAGFIGNVGNLSGIVAIVISCTLDLDSVSNFAAFTMEYDKGPGRDGVTAGFGLIIAACATQFLGGVFACIGTCQEIREVAYLAQQVQLKHDLEEGPPKTRAEKAHIEHDKEDALARERYANLKKRQEAGDPYTVDAPDAKKKPGQPAGDTGEKPKMRRPYLEKVLFRQPQSEDDECPTKMLQDAFDEIDVDRSGSIDMDEIIEALSDCNIAVSKTAADTIMKEIDKNASGDVDLREFIMFFRRIEELKRFDQKNQQRQQFAAFLANFCFLADVVVVGVMLMLFIKMDEEEDADTYAITKNVMIACIGLLAFLFILVVLMPILRLSLGPTAGRLQKQYNLAKEIKQRQKKMMDDMDDQDGSGPRRLAYTADDPAPPVNAAMFGRSYLPRKVTQNAWAPTLEEMNAPQAPQTPSTQPVPLSLQDGHAGSRAGSHHTPSHAGSHAGGRGHSHVRKGEWKYNPAYYAHAREFGEVIVQDNKGPMSWSPMQIRTPGHENQSMNAPNVPAALALTAMPGNMMR